MSVLPRRSWKIKETHLHPDNAENAGKRQNPTKNTEKYIYRVMVHV